MAIKCHEFLGCTKKECIMYNEDEKRNCWEIEPTSTSCTNKLPKSVTMENKIFHCHTCHYYKQAHGANKSSGRILGAVKDFFTGLRE